MNWEDLCVGKPRKLRAIGYLAQRIIESLPSEPAEDEIWEITIEQVIKHFDATKGSAYEVFHVFEALLLVSKVRK